MSGVCGKKDLGIASTWRSSGIQCPVNSFSQDLWWNGDGWEGAFQRGREAQAGEEDCGLLCSYAEEQADGVSEGWK